MRFCNRDSAASPWLGSSRVVTISPLNMTSDPRGLAPSSWARLRGASQAVSSPGVSCRERYELPAGESTLVEPMPDFAQLELRFVDQLQWRYELIRPLVLFEGGTAAQRAQETQTHPQTVRKLTRRFQQQGMLGLFPDNLEVIPAGRARRSSPCSPGPSSRGGRARMTHAGWGPRCSRSR